MSLANLLREAKGGACPPLLRSYLVRLPDKANGCAKKSCDSMKVGPTRTIRSFTRSSRSFQEIASEAVVLEAKSTCQYGMMLRAISCG